VWLETRDRKCVDLCKRITYLRARRAGERFAAALGVPLVDRAGGNESSRPPEVLDVPLRDRLVPADEPGAILPPEAIGVTIEERAENTVLTLAPRRYYSAVGIWILPVGAWGLWRWVPFFKEATYLRILLYLLALGAVTVGFVMLVNLLLRPAVKERIVVTPRGVRITHRRLLVLRTARFRHDELEELVVEWRRYHPGLADLPGHKVLCARGDRAYIEIGYGLPDWQLDTLRVKISAALQARTRPGSA